MSETIVKPAAGKAALSASELKLIDAYWRAANYLSVGQIYLYDNPLLKKPLKREHVKPRLLGHWGTTPGLNFVYVHLNRVIRERDHIAEGLDRPARGLAYPKEPASDEAARYEDADRAGEDEFFTIGARRLAGCKWG